MIRSGVIVIETVKSVIGGNAHENGQESDRSYFFQYRMLWIVDIIRGGLTMDLRRYMLKTIWSNVRYKGHIYGKGSLILGMEDHLRISRTARLQLDGDLVLGLLRKGRNGRSCILRMDEDSILEIQGDFQFAYGADIVLFKGARLVLGKGSYINSDCKIRCHAEITIGEDCAISHDLTLMDSDAHSLDGDKGTHPVHIGDHVWIGTRVTILSGVKIGDGAVIAAGALVKRDVPAGALAAGVPAKVVRGQVTWSD